jgi:hypothetical protein
MAEQTMRLSEDEQKFAGLVERIFTDQNFARAMEANPAEALHQAGFTLTDQQRQQLASGAHAEALRHPEAAIPAIVRPAVSVLTRGTRPVTTIVTRGTQPVVQVVTGTIVRVQEAEKDERAR